MSFEKVSSGEQPYYLHLGDCLAYLKTLPPNSISAVVTDPPYGMSQHSQQDIINALTAWLAGEEYTHGKSGFMGKEWDSFVPSPTIWKEVLRVLKPGGHILCAASTRTVDLMGISLRLAGFEIRDSITEVYDSDTGKQAFFDSLSSEQIKLLQRGFGEQFTVEWGYGSGFPKSANISKQMDKEAGIEREVIGSCITRDLARKNGKHKGDMLVNCYDGSTEISITAPATEAAKQYSGFGTALKPAHEPFILARKPIEKGLTIAQNCLKWGVGGLDIASSRIPADENDINARTQKSIKGNISGKTSYQIPANGKGWDGQQGRFPANVILDDSECVRALFPETKSGEIKPYEIKGNRNIDFSKGLTHKTGRRLASQGSAARFFYCAKASPSERNKGLDGLEENIGVGNYLASAKWTNDPRHKDGGYMAAPSKPQANHHPTVKPISLCEYLIKLISKENDTVLDPFTGSGTTGVAALNLNRRFIGCELNHDYFEIAKARIEQVLNEPKQEELFNDSMA